MSVTAAQITRVRALADASATEFTDAAITLAIEEYPKADADGVFPSSEDWVETYDLYRAAADVAEQRAAKLATAYDTTADGATLHRSQMQEQLYALAARLRSRAAATAIILPTPETDAGDDDDDD